jgi:hypothetical protein
MVSVLDIEPEIRGFKPGRGWRIFKGYKIYSMHSFGGEVKPLAPSRNILQRIKEPFEVWKRYFIRPSS